MMQVFMIPGMGADERIFKNIKLNHADITYINWLEAFESDTLVSYAQRIIDEYVIEPGSVMIGNSLGGMLAVEIAKKIPLAKVILISSIKTIDEAPLYFKLFKLLPVHAVVPAAWLTKIGKMLTPVFGRMYPVDAYLFNSMLQNTSPKFLQWSMGAVLKWKNKIVPPNLYHINGDNDRVFDYRKIKNATVIKGGTHIMILDKAREINELLNKILAV